MTSEQLAWLAGLYEGEGWCELSQRATKSWGISLRIGSTDRDVLESVEAVAGGKVRNLSQVTGNGKPIYQWSVSRRDHVLSLIEGMWPFLHGRRRAQLAPLRDHCRAALAVRPTLPKYDGTLPDIPSLPDLIPSDEPATFI